MAEDSTPHAAIPAAESTEILRRFESGPNLWDKVTACCVKMLIFQDSPEAAQAWKKLTDMCFGFIEKRRKEQCPSVLAAISVEEEDQRAWIQAKIWEQIQHFRTVEETEILAAAVSGSFNYLPQRIFSRAIDVARRKRPPVLRVTDILPPDYHETPEEFLGDLAWYGENSRPKETDPIAVVDGLLRKHGPELKKSAGEIGIEAIKWLGREIARDPNESPRVLRAKLTRHVAGQKGVGDRQARDIVKRVWERITPDKETRELYQRLSVYCGRQAFPRGRVPGFEDIICAYTEHPSNPKVGATKRFIEDFGKSEGRKAT